MCTLLFFLVLLSFTQPSHSASTPLVSRVAAEHAVASTALTRALLPAPLLLLPQLGMIAVDRLMPRIAGMQAEPLVCFDMFRVSKQSWGRPII